MVDNENRDDKGGEYRDAAATWDRPIMNATLTRFIDEPKLRADMDHDPGQKQRDRQSDKKRGGWYDDHSNVSGEIA